MDFLSDDTIERFKKRHEKSDKGEADLEPLVDPSLSPHLNQKRKPLETSSECTPKTQDFDAYSRAKMSSTHKRQSVETGKLRTKAQEHKKQQHHREFLVKSLGNFENLRLKLGLSQRKMGELLMVDPSAWNRWVKNPESIPSSIYQSLYWYLQLRKLNVTDQNVSYEQFDGYVKHQDSLHQIKDSLSELDQRVKDSESSNRQYFAENTRLKQEVEKLKHSLRIRTYGLIGGLFAALLIGILLSK